ncbi:MAG: hypothetical protein PHF35_05075 [Candidatus Moranbacteria bacterium]|nr:hypothetical protein [Candidatus Moranbacteria bacterium]
MPLHTRKKKIHGLKGLFRPISIAANRELEPFILVFVYPPENFEQCPLGTVFGIIKIEGSPKDSSFVVNLLASVIKKEFFARPDRPAYESFEASLQKANLALAELARQGSVHWIGKISFAGGALEKNNLHFSKIGHASILLSRNGLIADIGQGIGEDNFESESNPIKTFSDISSGKLEKGDRLIFTTSDLLDIFSLEELRQNFSRFGRDEFPNIVSASLKANSELSGSVIIDIVPEEETEPAISHTEIKKIIPEIKEKLIPEPLPQVPTARQKPPLDIPPAEKKSFLPNSLYISEAEEIIPKESFFKKSGKYLVNLYDRAKPATFSAEKYFSAFFQLVSKWKEKRPAFRLPSVPAIPKPPIPEKFRSIKDINWRRPLSGRWKITSGAIAALILVILIAAYLARQRSTQPAGTETPTENSAPTTAFDDIKVKNIEEISQVAPLPDDSRQIILLDGTLYTLVSEKSLIEIHPQNGEEKTSDSQIDSGKFTLATAMPDLNTIFIFTEDKKIIAFTPINSRFTENNISLPGNFKAADMKTYLTYLYFLDTNANQIYRFPRAEGGFGEGKSWLNSGADIKNANSFAINEDVFVADQNKISSYLQGKIDDKINFESPETPLSIDEIYSNPDLENVYALDNSNHRIVQFSKDGKIQNQYFNESISGIGSFTADEKNKVIYLQQPGSLSKFSIE